MLLPAIPPRFSILAWFLAGMLTLLPVVPVMAQAPASLEPVATASLQASTQMQADDYFHLQKKIYRWNDKTKFVLVHISTAQYLPDWQPWNVQIIKDAFAEWQRALDNRLMFVFVNDPSQADVMIHWWNIVTPEVEKGACGINKMETWGKYIAKNDIFISLHSETGYPWPPNQLYSTALHEIGHMLGIQAHSDNPNDLMYYASSHQQHLTQRDINTIRKIYAAKANYTNPAGYHLSRFEDFKKTQKGKGFWFPIIIPIPI